METETARGDTQDGVPKQAGSASAPSRGRPAAAAVVAALVVAVGAGGMVPAGVSAQETATDRIERANVTTDGVQSSGPAALQPRVPEGSISADGSVVAFWSFAPDLVPGDVCCTTDVFVHDFDTGVTERVPGTGGVSDNFAVSPDGRYVAYERRLGTMVGAPDDRRIWVAVYDRETGRTMPAVEPSSRLERVSNPLYLDSGYLSTVQQAAESSTPYMTTGHRPCEVSPSRRVSLSGDGRWCVRVVPEQPAPAPGGPGLQVEATTGRDEIAILDDELTIDGEVPDDTPWAVGQSRTGRFLVFTSEASNHVEGDANGRSDVFLVDRDPDGNGTYDEQARLPVERVSQAVGGGDASSGSAGTGISADGRFVVFGSPARDLVPGEDDNNANDLFRYDRIRGVTERITVAVDGGVPDGVTERFAVSADGTRVAFDSWAPDLVPGDTNRWVDVFRWAEGADGSSTAGASAG